jgi:hypothetical protein
MKGFGRIVDAITDAHHVNVGTRVIRACLYRATAGVLGGGTGSARPHGNQRKAHEK